MRRFLTTLAFSMNALAFGAIACASLVASHGHMRWGDANSAAGALAIGLCAVLVMLASALPTAQDSLLRWLASPAGRILGRITAPVLMLFVLAVASVTVLQRTEPILGVFGARHVLLVFLVYALLMILAFVVPGLAYPRRERPVRAPIRRSCPGIPGDATPAATRIPAVDRRSARVPPPDVLPPHGAGLTTWPSS